MGDFVERGKVELFRRTGVEAEYVGIVGVGLEFGTDDGFDRGFLGGELGGFGESDAHAGGKGSGEGSCLFLNKPATIPPSYFTSLGNNVAGGVVSSSL